MSRALRLTPLLSYVICAMSVALLIAVGVWYVEADDTQPASAGMHLRQADWQIENAPDLRTPPLDVDSKSLPDAWHHIVLPAAFPAASRPSHTISTT